MISFCTANRAITGTIPPVFAHGNIGDELSSHARTQQREQKRAQERSLCRVRPYFGSHKGTTAQKSPYSAQKLRENVRIRGLLADAEKELSRENKAEALYNCQTASWAFSKKDNIRLVDFEGKAVRQTYHCDHRLCPHCAGRRASKLKENLKGIIDVEWGNRRQKLLTLTIDDTPGESLKSASARILEAFKKLRRRKGFKEKIRGGVRAFEVTQNSDNDSWHVHLHVLMDADYWTQEELLGLWRKCLGSGDKKGGARIEESRSGIDEVVKYTVKGVEAAEKWPKEKLKEFLYWATGRRMVQGFGNLYGAKLPEEEGEGEVSESELMRELHKEGIAGLHPLTGELVPDDDAVWVSGNKANDEGYRFMDDFWNAVWGFPD